MGLIVQKFGGTSVGSAERIRRVAERLLATQRAGHDVVAVISAMAGVTDNLIKLANELSPQPSARERGGGVGPASLFDQDDAENWIMSTRGANGVVINRHPLNYQSAVGHGDVLDIDAVPLHRDNKNGTEQAPRGPHQNRTTWPVEADASKLIGEPMANVPLVVNEATGAWSGTNATPRTFAPTLIAVPGVFDDTVVGPPVSQPVGGP